MRTSKRIKERERQTVHSKCQQLRKLDRDRRREPSSCTEPDRKWPARHQGSLCEQHYHDRTIDKDELPLIYQGCPQFLPSFNHSRIRWAPFRSAIATWVEQNLQLNEPDVTRNKRLPEILSVRGWKGASCPSLYEPKTLNSKSHQVNSRLILASSRKLLASHHIQLPLRDFCRSWPRDPQKNITWPNTSTNPLADLQLQGRPS